MFFSWLSLLKKKHVKKVDFSKKNHGLTPFQNDYFLDFFRTSLFRSKKHYFPFRISKNVFFWLSLLKKKHASKRWIFLKKNHALTPFQNDDFMDFFRTSLFRSKKNPFLSRISQNVSFWLFLLKKIS